MKENKAIIPIIFSSFLDRTTSLPLYRQYYEGLRQAILTGQIAAGTKLPSTRQLAAELGISRNTVMNAFAQLQSEGYLEGSARAGTYVTRSLPDDILKVTTPPAARPPDQVGTKSPLSRRSSFLQNSSSRYLDISNRPEAFRPGLPALDAFPLQIWSQLTVKRWRHCSTQALDYGDPAGYYPLRQAIADYLVAVRGVHCEPGQVLIVGGSQQALDLAMRVLLDPGDHAFRGGEKKFKKCVQKSLVLPVLLWYYYMEWSF